MNFYPTDLLQSRQVIESIMSIMKEGTLVLNSRNEIEVVNDAALKLLGFLTLNELKGKHITELYASPDDAEKFISYLNENGHSDNWQNTFLRNDRRTFTGSYSGIQVQDPEGAGFYKIILLSDITAQKLSEQKLAGYTRRLEKSNKELDQFAYIVSHDLKAPLRAISNLSLWLQEDLGPTLLDESKNNLTMLRSRVMRLESLINGILQYSKIGRVQMAVEPVELYALITEVIEMLSPPSHIQVQIVGSMPLMMAPKVMLFQVFSNLIGNAIKYHDKAQGQINVSCMEKEQHYEFVVEDNGPGIPSEFFEKIFVIFQTLQSRDKFESTGIGLTIVKRIVEDRGGKVWVESTVGEGSRFIFTWPKQMEQ
jgi:PAS domain S-box-containing protein